MFIVVYRFRADFIKTYIILYGNPVGISQDYENIGKHIILISFEPGNTGKKIYFDNL